MATYRQEAEYYEDGFGMCKIIFKIAQFRKDLFDPNTIGAANHTGTGDGLDTDITTGGTYSGSGAAGYQIYIDAVPDGNITAFADAGGGKTTVTSAAHGRANGSTLVISGTTNYNGTWVIEGVTTDTFNIITAFVSDDATGTWEANSFKWSNDGGDTWEVTLVNITGAAQTLEFGITITFAAASGNALNDIWEFSIQVSVDNEIFAIGDSTEEREPESGELAEDELQFEIDESIIETDIDEAAKDYVLDAQTVGVVRHCAWFVCAESEDESTLANKIFMGLILPEMKAGVLEYQDKTEYDSTPDALYNWKIIAQPFNENMFDKIQIEDALADIDDTWVAANVEDRKGHYQGPDIHSVFTKLVNLNILLKKIMDIAINRFKDYGYGDYNYQLIESFIDGKFRPARFKHLYKVIAYHYCLQGDESDCQGWDTPLDDTDIRALQIGNISNESTSPFINIRAVKHYPDDCIDPKAAREFMWDRYAGMKDKTITDLLYKIAQNFGMYPQFYYDHNNDFNIQFIRRQDCGTTAVYIKDATSDDLETSSIENRDQAIKGFRGEAFYLSLEGYYSGYTKSKTGSENKAKYYYDTLYKEGVKLLLTLSPTLVKYLYNGSGFDKPRYPHNILCIDETQSIEFTQASYRSPDVHTAIYMKVSPYGSESGEPTEDYWTPAAYYDVKINNEERHFMEMYKFLYALRVEDREKFYYATERTLEVPYLMGFSASADGSSPHHSKLKLWYKITIDGNNYVVVGITRNPTEKTTKIKLHNESRFAFSDPSNLEIDKESDNDSDTGTGGYQFARAYTCSTIQAGEFVSKKFGSPYSYDCVEKSEAIASHYQRLYGVALNDAATGEWVLVQIGGEVEYSGWSIFTGSEVFLRTSTGCNISETKLTQKSSTEDLFARLGLVTGDRKFKIDLSQQFVYKV